MDGIDEIKLEVSNIVFNEQFSMYSYGEHILEYVKNRKVIVNGENEITYTYFMKLFNKHNCAYGKNI